MAKFIDGKKIAADVRREIAAETAAFKEAHGFAPGLTVIIVGEDPASQVYVRNKKRACEEKIFMPLCTEKGRLFRNCGNIVRKTGRKEGVP